MFASNLLQHPTHPNFAYICIFQSRLLIPVQPTSDFLNKPNNHTRHSLQLLHLLPGSFPDLLSTFRAPISALYCLVITPVFKMSVPAVPYSLTQAAMLNYMLRGNRSAAAARAAADQKLKRSSSSSS